MYKIVVYTFIFLLSESAGLVSGGDSIDNR